MILDCKDNFLPIMPQYSPEDRNSRRTNKWMNTKHPKSLLYFPVNYSNKPLTDKSRESMKALKSLDFQISFNVHDAKEDRIDIMKKYGLNQHTRIFASISSIKI